MQNPLSQTNRFGNHFALMTILQTLSIFATAAGLFISFIATAGGHGTYTPAAMFFPFGMSSIQFTDHRIGLFAMILAAIQFPVYVLITFILLRFIKTIWIALAIVSVIHILAFFYCIIVAN